MTNESTVQFIIDLTTTGLEEEELNRLTVTLLQQMKDLDEFEKVNRVAVEDEDIPKDAKSIEGFIVGMLMAEVNSQNIISAISWVHRRLSGKTLKFTIKTPQGTEISLEGSTLKDIEALMQKAEKFLNETEDPK
ncbi:hypothetical protein QUB11_28010 [Microcoleus sp. B6-A1]|uniref:hypothetical protein n=1 Tax=Microcoleus sp. B6-A1 TaxID=2818684 RepID=UPI002FD00A1C